MMNPHLQATLTGLRSNRWMVPQMVADVAEERMAEQFGTMVNHAAWLLGHMTIGLNFAAELCGSDYRAPADWQPLFEPGSVPTADRARYPDKATLLAEIDRAGAAVENRLPALDADALCKPFPVESYRSFWPTVGDGVVFLATTHFAYHLGQLSAWRRGLGLGKAMAM